MRVLDFVPEAIENVIRLACLRIRHRKSRLYSCKIAWDAEIGHNCRVAAGVQLGRRVSLGDNSYVNDGTIIASGRIGRFCSIGDHCSIGMQEHPLDFLSTSPRLYGAQNILGTPVNWNDFPSPPLIENDVWVGSQATVLQGVRIANGSVVAAGAVVTKNVPPYAIVAGVPARLVRYRFSPEDVERLLQLRWWDLSISEIRSMRQLFNTAGWQSNLPSEVSNARAGRDG
jgi:acetyltransferase-like isoleucine patch superfamily enzyme